MVYNKLKTKDKLHTFYKGRYCAKPYKTTKKPTFTLKEVKEMQKTFDYLAKII